MPPSVADGLVSAWPANPAKDFRATFYKCSEMIQLMENVYLDLHLEDTWGHPDKVGTVRSLVAVLDVIA